MEDDGFTLVTGKKGGKRGGYIKKGDTHIRVDGTAEEIEKAFKIAEIAVKNSGLVEWMVDRFNDFNISKIVILGNGHFDGSHEPGIHQLALFLELAEKLDIKDVVFQDPVVTEVEKSFLTAKNITIRQGPDVNIEIDLENNTLVGLIHGEHEILEQFLEYNSENLSRIAVLGNNYGAVNLALKKIEDTKIEEFIENSEVFAIPTRISEEFHSNAFSDTCLMMPKR